MGDLVDRMTTVDIPRRLDLAIIVTMEAAGNSRNRPEISTTKEAEDHGVGDLSV